MMDEHEDRIAPTEAFGVVSARTHTSEDRYAGKSKKPPVFEVSKADVIVTEQLTFPGRAEGVAPCGWHSRTATARSSGLRSCSAIRMLAESTAIGQYADGGLSIRGQTKL